jgi:hypothetical protein
LATASTSWVLPDLEGPRDTMSDRKWSPFFESPLSAGQVHHVRQRPQGAFQAEAWLTQ